MTTLEKVDKALILLGNAGNLAASLKNSAAKSEETSLAIKAANLLKAINELREDLSERRDAYIGRQVELGKMRRVPVENLDKPKLTLIKGGK